MCLAGALILLSSTRTAGSLLSGSLSVAGIYSFSRMGLPYWLPVVNTVLAGMILLSNRKSMLNRCENAADTVSVQDDDGPERQLIGLSIGSHDYRVDVTLWRSKNSF